ncbi:MAG: site-2 protease family protein [Acidimicrobiales bacterium]
MLEGSVPTVLGALSPTVRDYVIPIGVLVVSVMLHEVSHGVVALAFGDDTAKRAHRLTLNPLRHVDPFGSVLLPLLLILSSGAVFGYAKPVPVDPRRLRNPRQQMVLVSLAGPLTNLILALAASIAYASLRPADASVVSDALVAAIAINVVLAVFNAIPIPPLDGSAVVERLMPASWWPRWLRLRQYSMGLLLVFVLVVPGPLHALFSGAFRFWSDHVLRPLL